MPINNQEPSAEVIEQLEIWKELSKELSQARLLYTEGDQTPLYDLNDQFLQKINSGTESIFSRFYSFWCADNFALFGDPSSAIVQFEQIISQYGEETFEGITWHEHCLTAIYEVYINVEDWNGAIQAAMNLCEITTNVAGGLFDLAFAQESNGDLSGAVSSYENLIQKEGSNISSLVKQSHNRIHKISDPINNEFFSASELSEALKTTIISGDQLTFSEFLSLPYSIFTDSIGCANLIETEELIQNLVEKTGGFHLQWKELQQEEHSCKAYIDLIVEDTIFDEAGSVHTYSDEPNLINDFNTIKFQFVNENGIWRCSGAVFMTKNQILNMLNELDEFRQQSKANGEVYAGTLEQVVADEFGISTSALTASPLGKMTVKAPWDRAYHYRAGNLYKSIIGTVGSIVGVWAINWTSIFATIALHLASKCGYGIGGLYYNTSPTHLGEDNFAIDFSRHWAPFVPDNSPNAVLSVHQGLVLNLRRHKKSGSNTIANFVSVRFSPYSENITAFKPIEILLAAIKGDNSALEQFKRDMRLSSKNLHLEGPRPGGDNRFIVPVSIGQWLEQGTRIGHFGDTGNSVFTHLHFAIFDNTSGPAPSGNSIEYGILDGQSLSNGLCVSSSNKRIG